MDDGQLRPNPASLSTPSHVGSLPTAQQHAFTSALLHHMQQQQHLQQQQQQQQLLQQQQQLLRQLQLQQQIQLQSLQQRPPPPPQEQRAIDAGSLQLFPSAPPAAGNDAELLRGAAARVDEPDLRLSVGLSLGGAVARDGAQSAKRRQTDEFPLARAPESSGENSNVVTAAPPPPPPAPLPLFTFPPGAAACGAPPHWMTNLPGGAGAGAPVQQTGASPPMDGQLRQLGAAPTTPPPDEAPSGGWIGAGESRVPFGAGSPVAERAGGLSATGSAGGSGGDQLEGLDGQGAAGGNSRDPGKSSRPRTVAERKRRNGISVKLEQLKRALPQSNPRVTTEALLCETLTYIQALKAKVDILQREKSELLSQALGRQVQGR